MELLIPAEDHTAELDHVDQSSRQVHVRGPTVQSSIEHLGFSPQPVPVLLKEPLHPNPKPSRDPDLGPETHPGPGLVPRLRDRRVPVRGHTTSLYHTPPRGSDQGRARPIRRGILRGAVRPGPGRPALDPRSDI